MRTIVISGWYGCGNLGDEAILLASLDELTDRFPDARYIVISEIPEQVERDYSGYPLRAVPQRSYTRPLELARALADGTLWRVFRAVLGADLFLLGGGGLLRDNTSRRNVIRILDECMLANILRVPVAFLAIGVGPIRTSWGGALIGRVSRKATTITVRDAESAAILASIGLRRDAVHVTADPALLLRPSSPSRPDLRKLLERIERGEGTIGVCLCEGMFWDTTAEERERRLREIASLCDQIVERLNLTPVFLPFRAGTAGDDDLAVSDQVLERMGTRARAVRVTDPPHPKEARALFERFRYVIGARLHSIILACASGTPMVAINYEPKVAHFMDGISPSGLLVEAGTFTASSCVSFLDESGGCYADRRAALLAIASERAAMARRTFDLVCEASR